MRFNKRARVTALALVASVALAGCTPSGPDDSNGGEEQTLRLAVQAPPTSFAIGGWGGGEAYLFLSVYDTILQRAVDGEIEPAIAESWNYSEDSTVLTFDIRDGMEFSDGNPVDAEAVAASLDAARQSPALSGQMSSIAAIEATDESTVVMTLSKPDAALVPLLTGIAGAIGSPEVLTDESSQLEPVGSGAYVLDQDGTTVGSKYTLTRNDDNWNAAAYPYETIEFQVIPDPTAVQNGLKSGQLDFAGVAEDLLSQFPEDKFTTGNSNPQAVGALWLVDREGTIVPALADVRVRQAINLALDRDLITSSLNAGSSTATNQVYSPLGDAFREDLLETYAYDLDEARSLMEDAGYGDGFSVTMPSTSISTTYESTITQMLGEIGVVVTWESVPFQDFYAKVLGGSYGMFYMFNGLSGSDAQDTLASLQGLFNPFSSTTPELQELIDSANAASLADQGEAFGAVNEYFVDEAWYAPIASVTGFYVTTKDVTFTPPLVGSQTIRPFAPAGSN